MTTLGWIMILLFVYIFFGPFRAMQEMLAKQRIPEAAQRLNRIRLVVTTNLILGLITSAVAAAGRFH